MLVGDVKPKEPMIEVSKEHNAHFVLGLAKTGRTIAEEHVGTARNYAVLTRYGFGDMMLSAVTAGIYTPTTTKYYIPLRYMDGFRPAAKKIREKVHRDKGFTLMLDGGFTYGFGDLKQNADGDEESFPLKSVYGGSLAFGYRFSPHFVVGAGCGFERGSSDYDNARVSLIQPFGRVRYMLLDKKRTPFLGVDGGWMLPMGSYADQTGMRGSWFVAPHIGYQMRMGRNSYFDVGIGYRIGNIDLSEYEMKMRTGGISAKVGFSFTL